MMWQEIALLALVQGTVGFLVGYFGTRWIVNRFENKW